jgi:hypothetical protein
MSQYSSRDTSAPVCGAQRAGHFANWLSPSWDHHLPRGHEHESRVPRHGVLLLQRGRQPIPPARRAPRITVRRSLRGELVAQRRFLRWTHQAGLPPFLGQTRCRFRVPDLTSADPAEPTSHHAAGQHTLLLHHRRQAIPPACTAGQLTSLGSRIHSHDAGDNNQITGCHLRSATSPN